MKLILILITAIHLTAHAATPQKTKPLTTEHQLLALHNQARTAQNLPPLHLHPNLTQYAQHRSQTMAQRRAMKHSRLTFFPGSKFRLAAENIAFNQPAAQVVTQSWLTSTGHRRNILHPRHQYVGFAQTRDAEGRPYWCAVFGG